MNAFIIINGGGEGNERSKKREVKSTPTRDTGYVKLTSPMRDVFKGQLVVQNRTVSVQLHWFFSVRNAAQLLANVIKRFS